MTAPSVVFLDRDGTIIRDVAYLARPEQVELLDGAAAAVRRLNALDIPVIVVTNQSGIARGLFTVADYHRVTNRLDQLLHADGARLDATYFCPHLPSVTGECSCRKPATGLFREAIAEHGLDMSNPALVGDRWRDVAAVRELGGTGYMLQSRNTSEDEAALARAAGVVPVSSLTQAVEMMLDGVARVASETRDARRTRIAVLASGNGSNLQAILDHFNSLADARRGDLVLVASDRAAAPALERARRAGLATECFLPDDSPGIVDMLDAHGVEVVALAGYLKLLPASVVARFRNRIVNVHPGSLPRFGGQGMYGARVHAAVLASGEPCSAATVHLVDERFDRGPVLAQWPVAILPEDTAESLGARVLAAEHIIYPRVLDALAASVAATTHADRLTANANRAPLCIG